MSYNNGARTITNGLVMAFDAANIKCFKGEPTTNLGGAVHLGFTGERWAKTTDYPNKGALPFNLGTDVYRLANGNNYWGYASEFNIQYNKTYTLSYWYWVNTAQNIEWYNTVFGSPTAGGGPYANVSTKITDTFTTTNNTNGWKFGYVSFTTNVAVSSYSYLRGTYTGGSGDTTPTGNVYIANFQLEEKSYATAYTSGTRGATVATGGGMYDLSQTGNHGELVNGPTYNTGSGGNILFDGTDDYINVPYNASTISFPHNSATICAWYRVSTSGDAYGNLVTQRSSGGSGFQTYVISNKLYADGGGTGGIYSTITGVAGTIYFGTIVFDKLSAQLKLYVNGEYNTQTSYTGTIQDTYPIRIGNGAFGDGPFPGHIYMASVYNRALSADEIRRIYNSTKSRFGL